MIRLRFLDTGFIVLLILTMSPASAEGTTGVAYEFNLDGVRAYAHIVRQFNTYNVLVQC